MGCVRKDDGTVHFFVNGVDQGPAATNVPADVYGVIDLYGQAAQATIVDNSGEFQCRNIQNSCQMFVFVLKVSFEIRTNFHVSKSDTVCLCYTITRSA